MATWYVRPNTSHSATRDGTSYDTAWGGWSEIVWTSQGFKAPDDLYICGQHYYAAQINTGYHASTANSKATIRGDYAPDPGVITFTASAWVFINRDYTTLKNLTINAGTAYCVYINGAPNTGTLIQGCTFTAGPTLQAINLFNADNQAFVDLTIDGNTFTGGNTTGVGSAIQWLASASLTTPRYLTRLSITNNLFLNGKSNRAVIDLRLEDLTTNTSYISDLTVSGNEFRNCAGVAVEAYIGVLGRNSGIRVTDNVMTGMYNLPGGMGGCFSIGGFGQSTTSGFGSNVIARNRGSRIAGPSGFCNTFFGTYRVFNNYCEDLTTDTIDGNGILFDHGSKDCIAHGNFIRRLTGNGAEGYYSGGFGILILDATGCIAYGNVIDGCVTGLAFGVKAGGQSSSVFNNTFANCSLAGAYLVSGSDLGTNQVKNNLFTASRPTYSVRNGTGTWTGEAGNCFSGFNGATGHTLNAGTITDDPKLDNDFRPQAAALVRSGANLGGKDFNGKQFYNPPNIGAVDDLTATPRYSFVDRKNYFLR
ncbi:MAG: hypothetical protein ABI216_22075 [Devosia sp.]